MTLQTPPDVPTPLDYAGKPASEAASRYSKTRSDRLTRLLWPLLALAALLLFDAVFLKGFFHVELRDGRLFGATLDILNRVTPVALMAVGMTLVIATGGVDLSVGSLLAISGAVAAVLMGRQGWAMPMAVMAALLVATAAGAWNGLLVALLDLQPIVATLVMMVAGRGVAQLIAGEHAEVNNDAFAFIAHGTVLHVRFTFLLVAVAAGLAGLLTRGTAAGLFIESVGGNATASRYAGVNARLVKLLAYAVSGLCAGIAGLVDAADIGDANAHHAGQYKELDAILAVVIGGTALTGGRFSLVGSLLGALIIQTLTTTIDSTRVKPEATLVVKAAVVLIVCLLQSEALRSTIGGRLRLNSRNPKPESPNQIRMPE